MIDEHLSFLSKFKRGIEGSQWKVYYEKSIASAVSFSKFALIYIEITETKSIIIFFDSDPKY